MTMAVKSIILPAILALFTTSNSADRMNVRLADLGIRHEVAARDDARPTTLGERDRWDVRLAGRKIRSNPVLVALAEGDARSSAWELRANHFERRA
jgi:hypothetical protein